MVYLMSSQSPLLLYPFVAMSTAQTALDLPVQVCTMLDNEVSRCCGVGEYGGVRHTTRDHLPCLATKARQLGPRL